MRHSPFLSLAFSIAVFAQAPRTTDKTALIPDHQASFAAAYYRDATSPTFDNGYVISRAAGGDPIVTLLDKNGLSGPRLILSFPDGQAIKIANIAVSSKGEPIIGGGYTPTSHFIAKADPITGKLSNPIQTEALVPKQICEDGDGNIWAFGFELDAAKKTYDQLRQYSFDKGMLRSLLPNKEMAFSLHDKGTYLRCSDKTVGVYSSSALEWTTIDTATGAKKKYRVDRKSLGTLLLNGFALTSTAAYASFTDDPTGDHDTVHVLAKLSCSDERKLCSWNVIEGTAHDTKHPGPIELLGADKDELVYILGYAKLEWARPQ